MFSQIYYTFLNINNFQIIKFLSIIITYCGIQKFTSDSFLGFNFRIYNNKIKIYFSKLRGFGVLGFWG
jgi:hypothetical protein